MYVVYYANDHAAQTYQAYTTQKDAEDAVRYLKKQGNNAWWTLERSRQFVAEGRKVTY